MISALVVIMGIGSRVGKVPRAGAPCEEMVTGKKQSPLLKKSVMPVEACCLQCVDLEHAHMC